MKTSFDASCAAQPPSIEATCSQSTGFKRKSNPRPTPVSDAIAEILGGKQRNAGTTSMVEI